MRSSTPQPQPHSASHSHSQSSEPCMAVRGFETYVPPANVRHASTECHG
jgi:hypothetical protein